MISEHAELFSSTLILPLLPYTFTLSIINKGNLEVTLTKKLEKMLRK